MYALNGAVQIASKPARMTEAGGGSLSVESSVFSAARRAASSGSTEAAIDVVVQAMFGGYQEDELYR